MTACSTRAKWLNTDDTVADNALFFEDLGTSGLFYNVTAEINGVGNVLQRGFSNDTIGKAV